MNRRGFLQLLTAATVTAASGIELLELWKPTPSTTYFLPPSVGWASYSDELAAIIRRAFIPKMVSQTYKASPLMQALLADQPWNRLEFQVRA